MGLSCRVLLTQNEIGQRWVDHQTNLSDPPHDHQSFVPTTLGRRYEFWSTLFSACPFFLNNQSILPIPFIKT